MKYLLLGLVAGAGLGICGFGYKFDPKTLENNAIQLSELSFLRGCITGIHSVQEVNPSDFYNCRNMAAQHRKDMADIIKNKIWDK